MSAISSNTVRTHRQNHARLIAGALALAGAAAIFGFAIVLAGNGSRDVHHAAVNASAAKAVFVGAGASAQAPAGLSGSLRGAFGVLRRTPTGASRALPHSLATSFSHPPAWMAKIGLDVSQAEYVPTAVGDAWIVPGAAGLCMMSSITLPDGRLSYSGGCSRTAGALAGREIGTTLLNGTTTLVGLAPDGNPTVIVTMSDGSSEVVPVRDNVYVARGPAFRTVALRSAGGAVESVSTPDSVSTP